MKRKKYRVGELRERPLTKAEKQEIYDAHKATGVCMWFAGCTNPAVKTQSHPILGDVPICQRHADWYERMK